MHFNAHTHLQTRAQTHTHTWPLYAELNFNTYTKFHQNQTHNNGNMSEYVTMRKETVDLSIRSWLCFTHVGSSSAVNLRFVCEPLRDRVINLILGGI